MDERVYLIKSIARAVNTKNLQQKETHCSLDIIHALGKAAISHSIGVSALHVIDGLQPQGYQQLIFELSRAAGRRLKCDKQILLRLCKQVIHEAAFNFCETCSGRKHFVEENKVHICGSCNGVGLKRYSDKERSKSLNISEQEYIKHWADRHTTVQSIFTSEYRNALHAARLKMAE